MRIEHITVMCDQCGAVVQETGSEDLVEHGGRYCTQVDVGKAGVLSIDIDFSDAGHRNSKLRDVCALCALQLLVSTIQNGNFIFKRGSSNG